MTSNIKYKRQCFYKASIEALLSSHSDILWAHSIILFIQERCTSTPLLNLSACCQRCIISLLMGAQQSTYFALYIRSWILYLRELKQSGLMKLEEASEIWLRFIKRKKSSGKEPRHLVLSNSRARAHGNENPASEFMHVPGKSDECFFILFKRGHAVKPNSCKIQEFCNNHRFGICHTTLGTKFGNNLF